MEKCKSWYHGVTNSYGTKKGKERPNSNWNKTVGRMEGRQMSRGWRGRWVKGGRRWVKR